MVPGSVLSKKLPDENFLNLGDDVYGVEFLNCKLWIVNMYGVQ